MTLPLEGIRILDLSRLLPGPYCSMLLADFGAEVVKIEDPQGGDYLRWVGPYIENRGTQFMALNRNKKSVKLNLKKPRGVEIFLKLAERFDVVLDSFRPGVLDRLGAGYAAASEVNPRIIYCSITGYGKDGPYRDRAGHDINFTGYSGILSLTGGRGEPPSVPGVQAGDMGAALMAAVGVLTALMARERTGKGQFVDVSMLDSAVAMLPLVVAAVAGGDPVPLRGESMLTGGQPCYGVYETSDGKYIDIGAIEPKFFKRFCELVQRPDLEPLHFDTGKGRGRLEAELTTLFRSQTRAHWCALLESEDVCCGPALTVDEMMQDPQVLARGMIIDVETRSGAVQQTGIPIKLSGTPGAVRTPPPEFGEHTAEVLAEAGVSAAEFEELKNQGVI